MRQEDAAYSLVSLLARPGMLYAAVVADVPAGDVANELEDLLPPARPLPLALHARLLRPSRPVGDGRGRGLAGAGEFAVDVWEQHESRRGRERGDHGIVGVKRGTRGELVDREDFGAGGRAGKVGAS
eukprot:765683-Hanusia_phi.AAC.5